MEKIRTHKINYNVEAVMLKIKFHAVIIMVAMIFLWAAQTGSAHANETESALESQKISKIEQVIEKTMETEKLPGVIALVSAPDFNPLIITKGYANLSTKRPMSANDIVRIASLTKTFTATVIMQLAGEGRLDLDDKISKFENKIPVIKKMRYRNSITIRNLLTHNSGLENYFIDKKFESDYYNRPLLSWTPEQLINISLKHRQKRPGGKAVYSNTNFILLGMIIEALTANSYESEVVQRILIPAGLTHTYFPKSVSIKGVFAHGYMNGKDVTLIDSSCGWAAGSLISNLEDLWKWNGIFAEGELLDPKINAERQKTVPVKGSPQTTYGPGSMNIGNLTGHTGSITGYKHAMLYLPSKKATIIVLSNYESPAADLLCLTIAKIAFPEAVGY